MMMGISALNEARLALVGGGVMGTAIAAGLLQRGLVQPAQVTISEPLAARRQTLAAELGVITTADNAQAVSAADLVLLAVKPQVLAEVLGGLKDALRPDALVLSIVAGATLDTLCEGLGVAAVVRVMPNTPAQVGQGATVWTATPAVSAGQREMVARILEALGVAVYVESERYLDAATALSGSGPAYVLLFIEALTDVGVEMGFTRDVAARLALQTVKGTAIYAEQSGQHPAILRNQVTSPGGTTAAALFAFEQGAFRAVVAAAVKAAWRRATELGAR
jgi:pyrroline-5-carboxylate reductase